MEFGGQMQMDRFFFLKPYMIFSLLSYYQQVSFITGTFLPEISTELPIPFQKPYTSKLYYDITAIPPENFYPIRNMQI